MKKHLVITKKAVFDFARSVKANRKAADKATTGGDLLCALHALDDLCDKTIPLDLMLAVSKQVNNEEEK